MLTAERKRMSKLVRAAAGASGKPWPIKLVPGDGPPAVVGKSFYHTTPSGKTIVRHPNAYGYRTLYHPSTIRIEVGRGWLLEHGFTATLLAELFGIESPPEETDMPLIVQTYDHGSGSAETALRMALTVLSPDEREKTMTEYEAVTIAEKLLREMLRKARAREDYAAEAAAHAELPGPG